MNRERIHWLAIGLLLTSLASAVLAVATLSGFGGAPSGDLIVASTAASTNLLLAGGTLALLVLEFAHMHRRPVRVRRTASAPEAIKA
jgi:membrane protein implicated in regulation of membrane protease activity